MFENFLGSDPGYLPGPRLAASPATGPRMHAYQHDNIAPFETPTPGYDLLNAERVYTVPTTRLFD